MEQWIQVETTNDRRRLITLLNDCVHFSRGVLPGVQPSTAPQQPALATDATHLVTWMTIAHGVCNNEIMLVVCSQHD